MTLKKNYLLAGLIVIIIAAGAIFLTQSSTEKTTNADTKIVPTPIPTATPAPVSLRLGYLPTSGHALEFIAKEKGFFAEQGLDVELFEFSNSAEGHNALLAKKLDLIAIGHSRSTGFHCQRLRFCFNRRIDERRRRCNCKARKSRAIQGY